MTESGYKIGCEQQRIAKLEEENESLRLSLDAAVVYGKIMREELWQLSNRMQRMLNIHARKVEGGFKLRYEWSNLSYCRYDLCVKQFSEMFPFDPKEAYSAEFFTGYGLEDSVEEFVINRVGLKRNPFSK